MNCLLGGVVGSGALTLLHEGLRQVEPDAPRVDLLGMESMERWVTGPTDHLREKTLAADLVSNALFYSLAGCCGAGSAPWVGLALGAAAGAGTVLAAGPLGLNESTVNRTPKTQAMTVAYYAFGGLMAGLAISVLSRDASASREHSLFL